MSMFNRPKRLTEAFVERVNETGRYGDGRGSYGLSILVKPYQDGEGFAKSWAQRLYINGKAKNLGLGSYPAVTLDMARERAILNARAAKQEQTQYIVAQPTYRVPVQEATPIPVSTMPITPLFREVVEDTIQQLQHGWKGKKTRKNWDSRMNKHVLPYIGDMLTDEITPADISAVLLPIWNTKRSVAVQVKSNLNFALNYSVSRGYLASNPMSIAQLGLMGNPQKTKHHNSIPYQELSGAIDTFNGRRTNDTNRDMFLLLALTGVRFSQARLAQWKEIDFKLELWTSPPENVKATMAHARPHLIPLSRQALQMLKSRALDALPNPNDYIFAQLDKGGKLISERITLHTIQAAWNGQKAWGDLPTLHGLRTSFSTWAQDLTEYPEGLIKAAIDHVNLTEADRAYLRSKMVDKRRELMQDWADYIR